MLATTSDGKLMDPCMIEAIQSKSDGGVFKRDGVTMWKQENQTMTSSIMVSWVDWLAAQFNDEEKRRTVTDHTY